MEAKRRLFVSNIDFEVTNEELRVMFEEIGPCLSVVIATDRETKRSRGFAFIEMEGSEAAEKAVKELNEKVINNRPMKVAFDKGKTADTRPNQKYEILPPIQRVPVFKRYKKVDPYIQDPEKEISYKDVAALSQYVSERGRILSRKYTGLSAYNQRQMKKAIKRAQHLGLMAFSR